MPMTAIRTRLLAPCQANRGRADETASVAAAVRRNSRRVAIQDSPQGAESTFDYYRGANRFPGRNGCRISGGMRYFPAARPRTVVSRSVRRHHRGLMKHALLCTRSRPGSPHRHARRRVPARRGADAANIGASPAAALRHLGRGHRGDGQDGQSRRRLRPVRERRLEAEDRDPRRPGVHRRRLRRLQPLAGADSRHHRPGAGDEPARRHVSRAS